MAGVGETKTQTSPVIAITAASGQLGAAVVRQLRDHWPDVTTIGLARTPRNAADLGVEIRPGDYDDQQSLETSLAGVDSLLLVSGNGDPAARISQHRRVIDAARVAGVSKIVYTSIQGADEGTAFSPIVASNRQTERDLQASGLDWVIGRNGLYIEPDIEAIDSYLEAGEIVNCADGGLCGYTTRDELSAAYAAMLVGAEHVATVYNLHGDLMTQAELAGYIGDAYGVDLTYRCVSVADYRADRIAHLGDFVGAVIGGIYEGIRQGALANPSDYAQAAGRPHLAWRDYFSRLRPA